MMTVHSIFTLVTVLVAGAIGFLLRGLLVHRLKNSVLDNWLVQTLGIIVMVTLLILAVPVIVAIWDITLITNFVISLKLQEHIGQITDVARSVVLTILIVVLGLGVARTMQKIAIRNLGENRIDINIRTLIGRILYFAILAIAIFWTLAVWQVSIGAPLAIIGTLTVAFAFAIQDILKDLVAGIFILVERPFHIGDEISVQTTAQAYTGKVEDVQIRATKLRLLSGEEVTIPNTQVFGSAVINNSFYGERRATLTATLAQEVFVKDETAQQIIGALKEIERVMPKPEPSVILSGYTGNQVTLTIRFWMENGRSDTLSEVIYALHTAFPDVDLAVKESAGAV